MLEYFTYKKVKKHRTEKAERERLASSPSAASPSAPPPTTIVSKPNDEPIGTPLLNQEDERFLERITSPDSSAVGDNGYDDENPPPLPPRVPTPMLSWDSDAESFKSQEAKAKDKGKGKAGKTDVKDADKKPANKRFSVITNIGRTISQRAKRPSTENSGLKPAQLAVPERELHREETDISRVLDDLNLSASNNKAFSLSADSTEMVRKFNLVLKDLVNGVPTAYGDLVRLLDDRDGILAKNYEKLPNSLKKLVTQLPNKLTSTLAPELLAVAAEAQGLRTEDMGKGGLKGAAKSFLTPKNLQEIVTKPGAVVGLLKGIVNALKTRWPAFMGTNVLWSVAIFLLLSALWYCHKRGREERLEREATEKDPLHGVDRVEELPDDPQLPAPAQASGSATPPPVQGRSGKASPPRVKSSRK
ncbi:uncharacterized protein JN550_001264 [Neoarthrinium moseri]|uniref:uncharacterized protein n=1 Tax=Neoarthrinium moseri TaxID=1658444 RepID=UPI001FDAF04C|nr:uncharacterized protein JN550_001264 [Neoarthrinium moseri]KAI1877192.1 hypothetical protein JN550_001264 [Neoarthrinium moseri]